MTGRSPALHELQVAMQPKPDPEVATQDRLLKKAAETGRLRLAATGGCMRPLVEDGDVVDFAKLEGPLRTGWLVLARVGPTLVCHRVLESCGDGLCVAGDRSGFVDRVDPAAILGRVRRVGRGERGWHYGEIPCLPDRILAWLSSRRVRQRWGLAERLARRLMVALRLRWNRVP